MRLGCHPGSRGRLGARRLRCPCRPAKSWREISRQPYRCFKHSIPNAIIGFSPFPGTKRVLSSRDVVLVARRYGLAFPAGEQAPSLCVERIVRSSFYGRSEGGPGLCPRFPRSAAGGPGIQQSTSPSRPADVPAGGLEQAARKQPANTRDLAREADTTTTDTVSVVWAKVRISVDREIFLATETIPLGAVIRAEQIVSTRVPQFPSRESQPSSAYAIVGKVARRTIPAGQRIVAEVLGDPQGRASTGKRFMSRSIDGAATIHSGRGGSVFRKQRRKHSSPQSFEREELSCSDRRPRGQVVVVPDRSQRHEAATAPPDCALVLLGMPLAWPRSLPAPRNPPWINTFRR